MIPKIVYEAARWGGLVVSEERAVALTRFHDWLRDEAIPAGGVAPEERERLWGRHIADALTFAVGWRNRGRPDRMLDIGSGVGLPGIPLAVLLPEVRVTLLDRSGRRSRLARRACRILGLSQVDVIQGEVSAWTDPMPAIVSRAAMAPADLRPHLERILSPGGVAVLGGSHVAPSSEPGYDLIEIPARILDHRAWLRIMARP